MVYNEEISLLLDSPKENTMLSIKYLQPGFGEWSKDDGNRHLLELALLHYKMVVARCAEQEMTTEYWIFSRRVEELQTILDDIESTHQGHD